MGGKSGGKSAPRVSAPEGSDDDEDEDIDDEPGSDDDVPLFGEEAEAAAAVAGINDADEDFGQVLSPFGTETFSGADACWAHAESNYGFSLQALKRSIGSDWSDYHRIRLVNHLRRLGPEVARREAPLIFADSPMWTDDALLIPVLEDDLLLFDGGDESQDEEDAEIDKGKGKSKGKLGPSRDVLSGTAGYQSMAPDEELAKLRSEVASLRQLLASADDDPSRVSGGSEHAATNRDSAFATSPKEAARSLQGAAAVLRRWLTERPESIDGRTVLNAGCGSGLLGLVCAQLGAEKVLSVDASVEYLGMAKELAEANGLSGKIQLLRGQLADEEAAGVLGVACDGFLCERILQEPRLSATLPSLLSARSRHWRSGELSWVFPRFASLHIRAGDFSREIQEREALHQCHSLGELDLSSLAADIPEPLKASPAIANEKLHSEGRLASDSVEIFGPLDLSTATPEAALPCRVPFELELVQECCVTALLLELRLELIAPMEGALAAALPGVQTALHLPAADASPGSSVSAPLQLRGSEFQSLRGYLSAALLPGMSGLEVAVSMTAIRRDGNAAGMVDVCGTFQLPP
eukprot:TRINITY_DN10595_c0_g1_i1.p1 TRINITY_DN10595_c0_g1~~TRINITY_DN10595_c0_g1_i1.p1  ORF type:complete len:580 (-),score=148.18 TRINITY_DN10595_c0_g1_i1:348-2087(-)